MKIEESIGKFISSTRIEKNLSYRTIKAYGSDLKNFYEFFIARDIEQITVEDIRTYLGFLEKSCTNKDTTIRRKIATLKVFFNFLEDENIINRAPTRKLKSKYKVIERLPRIISTNEIKKLLRCAYNDTKNLYVINNDQDTDIKVDAKLTKCCRDRAIIEILFSTGIRIGELVQLNLNNISVGDKTILVLGKGGRERMAYLSSDEVINALQQYLSYRKPIKTSSNALFLNKFGTRLTVYSVENIFRELCKKAKIKNHYTPHSLRHTMATMLINNGADIRAVQEILGHTSIVSTQIYTRISCRHKKKVLTRYNGRNRLKISG